MALSSKNLISYKVELSLTDVERRGTWLCFGGGEEGNLKGILNIFSLKYPLAIQVELYRKKLGI